MGAIHYWAPTVAALGTLIVGMSAFWIYRRNSRLERARWAAELYKEFYQKVELKSVRDKLDCSTDADEVNQLVISETTEFTDYLNFFEYVLFLMNSKQLKRSEIEILFGYYLKCLQRHASVRNYIADPRSGYEGLAKLIGSKND
jgi:hypothetical protein